MRRPSLSALSGLLLLACAATAPPPGPSPAAVTSGGAAPAPLVDPAPKLRLPTDVRPTHEAIELEVDPARERFSGSVAIDVTLERPRAVLWLHGQGLHVTRASVASEGGPEVLATWAQVDAQGTASVTPAAPLGAGRATIRIAFDAPFDAHLEALHKVTEAGVPYAFTQFESTKARRAFPCFDEPAIKVPYDLTLAVPADARAIANTREVERHAAGDRARVRFGTTAPLPSYLLAFAVGPLDVVDAGDVPPNAIRKRPLPLRGVAARGRGSEMAYALKHTGEILAQLEAYFGTEYPWEKLDVLAVPAKLGAMENPGAITYRESWVLMDAHAPVTQRRAFATVSAHEMAHQWFGDLVTAAWWDDIWLNEAFATWMAAKTVDAWGHDDQGSVGLLGEIQDAMGNDSLASARSVRQPIATLDDVENAFDAITYQKGAAVLAMFERWIGPEAFQRGIRRYLAAHRFGAATADDFLEAMSAEAGRDVKGPFQSFLDRPGVPYVEAETRCDGAGARLHVMQSRYLPLGATGDTSLTWRVPVCARYGVAGGAPRERCALVTEAEQDVPLDACPTWVMPNAGAAGYYRFGLAAPDLAKLQKAGLASLDRREKVALSNALRAGVWRGTTSLRDALAASASFAADPHPEVAEEAIRLVELAREWLWSDGARPAIEAYERDLLRGPMAALGWSPAAGEGDDRAVRRRSVIEHLAMAARDPAVRAEAKRRGLAFLGYGKDGAIHPEAIDPNLGRIGLNVVGEEADHAQWDAMRAHLGETEEAVLRERLIRALARSHDPELVTRARELVFDPALRPDEAAQPIWVQLDDPDLRDATWAWIEASYDRLVARLPGDAAKTATIAMAGSFCDEAHAREAEAFFAPRIASIEGGPRVLAETVESVRQCAAAREAQAGSVRAMFASRASAATNRPPPPRSAP